MHLTRLEKAISYKNKAYTEIKAAIISQQIKPGEQLNERLLAETMGISRTPVREALQLLERDGWVTTEPWKGTVVKGLTESDIEEVFQLRMALEPLVIDLIIDHLGPSDFDRLSSLFEQQKAYGIDYNADAFIRVDRSFHAFLTNLTRNKRLIRIMNDLSDVMRWLGIKAIVHKERYHEVLDEHEKVIKELKRRNLVKARDAMLYHVLRTKEQIYRNIL